VAIISLNTIDAMIEIKYNFISNVMNNFKHVYDQTRNMSLARKILYTAVFIQLRLTYEENTKLVRTAHVDLLTLLQFD